jgi:hypothetical protein
MRVKTPGRKIVEKEMADLRKATDKASSHLQKASGDLAERLVALERMVERGLTSDELWGRLEAIGRELEALRLASEKELAKLRQASEREFKALLGASSRVARIMLSGPSPARGRKKGGKAAPARKARKTAAPKS